MENESTNRARIWLIGLCLLLATFAQTTFKEHLHWMGYIDWILLVVIYVALMRDSVIALLTATAAGIFHDLGSGVPVFGISGLSYVVAAYVAFWVSTSFFVEGALIRTATVAGSSVIAAIVKLSLYTFTVVDVVLPREAALELILGPTLNVVVSLMLFAALDRIFDFGRRAKIRRAEAMRSASRRRKWMVKNSESRWNVKRKKRYKLR